MAIYFSRSGIDRASIAGKKKFLTEQSSGGSPVRKLDQIVHDVFWDCVDSYAGIDHC